MRPSVWILILLWSWSAQFSQAQNASAESPAIPSGDTKLPVDPNVRTGTLPNGMRYFVRANKEPENRAELRLAVNVGSMMEDDDQQGLAHFTEHMAFNGTTHFKKSELVDYLESIGTKFGAHLNAYTSFDETVYMLQVPTDDKEIMNKAFLVLEDWAHGVSFDNDEIDKERGVVIEEWRLGRGPEMRMLYRYLPVIFAGSRYAERIPIGKKEILESFDYATIKRFYKDWYRPELMAVVAVGDFDPDQVEAQIKQRFGAIPASKGGRPREVYNIPGNKEPLVAVEQDKEAPMTMVQILHKHGPREIKTVDQYRELIVENLITSMVNGRLEEIQKKGNSPFMFSTTFYGSMVRASNSFMGMAVVNNEKAKEGLDILLSEVERARRHGFIPSELERAKQKALKEMEKAYKEAGKTESNRLAMEYVSNYLEQEPIPGIEMEYQLYQHFLPQITVEEVNKVIAGWVNDENQAIVITGPEKEGIDFPSKQDVLAMAKSVSNKELEPYKEFVDERPLISQEPKPGTITENKKVADLGITEWKLSNGVKVVFKPTDFKEDQIRMNAFSVGGTSRVGDGDFYSADMAAQIIAESGVGPFDKSTLDKKLAGKIAAVRPYLDDYYEGFWGECVTSDLETMLQLVYLYFTKPRKDQEAFDAVMGQISGFAEMSNSPDNAFRDTVQVVMNQNHLRRQPLNMTWLNQVDLGKAYFAYLDRFSDASDFTFVFVGNIDPSVAKPLVEKYLGGLPGMNRKENWKDRGIRPPAGRVEKEFKKGIEPKSMVSLRFNGTLAADAPEEEYKLKATMKVLSIMLRESMREEKGGVYGVRSDVEVTRIPEKAYTVKIDFGCAPENVNDLIATALKDIETLKLEGASDKNLLKTKETHRRERETDLRDNEWWIRTLEKSYMYEGKAPENMGKYLELVDKLTAKDIQETAKKYFSNEKYVQVVMNPEK